MTEKSALTLEDHHIVCELFNKSSMLQILKFEMNKLFFISQKTLICFFFVFFFCSPVLYNSIKSKPVLTFHASATLQNDLQALLQSPLQA